MSYRIIVCIKQVPALGEVRIDPDTHNLVRESVPSVLNPFDEFAIEEAVRIRERFGGIVTAITMGPPQAESALKTAVQMGADLGFLLTDRRLDLWTRDNGQQHGTGWSGTGRETEPLSCYLCKPS